MTSGATSENTMLSIPSKAQPSPLAKAMCQWVRVTSVPPATARKFAYWRCFRSSGPRSSAAGSVVIFHRNVLASVVGHERRRYKAYRRAKGDVDRDRVSRLIVGEQRGCDQRCRAAGNQRCQLIAERRTAVAQPGCERLGDQRRLWSVLHVMRDQRQDDRDKDCRGDRSVHHREI